MTSLTVITATWQRPKQLAVCLELVARQQTRGLGLSLSIEHLVVSDGPDPHAAELCRNRGARFLAHDTNRGAWGAFAKDTGIAAAGGEYVACWDDDNWYESTAALTLMLAARDHDVGIVQARHRDPGLCDPGLSNSGPFRVIPAEWRGVPELGEIDMLCACVRREVATRFPIAQPAETAGGTHAEDDPGQVPYAHDYHWLRRIHQSGASCRFVPTVIGLHL